MSCRLPSPSLPPPLPSPDYPPSRHDSGPAAEAPKHIASAGSQLSAGGIDSTNNKTRKIGGWCCSVPPLGRSVATVRVCSACHHKADIASAFMRNHVRQSMQAPARGRWRRRTRHGWAAVQRGRPPRGVRRRAGTTTPRCSRRRSGWWAASWRRTTSAAMPCSPGGAPLGRDRATFLPPVPACRLVDLASVGCFVDSPTVCTARLQQVSIEGPAEVSPPAWGPALVRGPRLPGRAPPGIWMRALRQRKVMGGAAGRQGAGDRRHPDARLPDAHRHPPRHHQPALPRGLQPQLGWGRLRWGPPTALPPHPPPCGPHALVV